MFYLYFVLPPVIIVVSLALIIFLISRKALDIKSEIEKGNGAEIESKLSVEVKSRGLYFLEKLAHLFKIFSLKFHNWLEEKLKFIRQRKAKFQLSKNKRNIDDKKNGERERENKEKTNDKRIKNSFLINIKDKVGIFDFKKNKKDNFKKDISSQTKREERIVKRRVMISEEVVLPEEKKDKLENVLIERIAVDPRDIEAYERLGDYYVGQNNDKDARECYKQVLKLNPRSVSVRKKIEDLINK